MRKMLLILFVGVLFLSCKDSVETMDKSKIVGKWNVTQYFNVKTGAYENISAMGWYAMFDNDGGYSSYSTSSYTGTYKIIGNNVEATVGSTIVSYDYISLSGNNAEFKMYYDRVASDFIKFKAVRETTIVTPEGGRR